MTHDYSSARPRLQARGWAVLVIGACVSVLGAGCIEDPFTYDKPAMSPGDWWMEEIVQGPNHMRARTDVEAVPAAYFADHAGRLLRLHQRFYNMTGELVTSQDEYLDATSLGTVKSVFPSYSVEGEIIGDATMSFDEPCSLLPGSISAASRWTVYCSGTIQSSFPDESVTRNVTATAAKVSILVGKHDFAGIQIAFSGVDSIIGSPNYDMIVVPGFCQSVHVNTGELTTTLVEHHCNGITLLEST